MVGGVVLVECKMSCKVVVSNACCNVDQRVSKTNRTEMNVQRRKDSNRDASNQAFWKSLSQRHKSSSGGDKVQPRTGSCQRLDYFHKRCRNEVFSLGVLNLRSAILTSVTIIMLRDYWFQGLSSLFLFMTVTDNAQKNLFTGLMDWGMNYLSPERKSGSLIRKILQFGGQPAIWLR